ncbi:MAG: xylulokinase [bacterium]|nr:xylulokinase [bacterium]
MKRYILAHDLGTSGNKATLFTTAGELVDSQTYPYETQYFHGNWAEQNPSDWWRAVCDSTGALISGIDGGKIACVAFSGQMMGCLCVDKKGNPLRNSIIYSDQRASFETRQLLDQIGEKEFYGITGHRASPSYSIEKLMWLKNNEPDTYSRTFKMLNAKDYINYKLTGNMATDYSDASGTNAFDLNTYQWSDKIVEISGIDGDKLPATRESIAVLGTVTSEASKDTGLPEGTPVVVGGGDGVCAGVGVGSIRPGIAYNYVGSSSWIALVVEKPIYDEQMRTMNWAHAVPGYLQPSGTMQTAGSSYNWLKNEICRFESEEAEKLSISPYEIINQIIEKSPPGANGIIFLPYLLGERTPRWNPDAKGAFIGLNLSHKREDILRAVLEGITYNLEIILSILRNHTAVEQMIVVGGGARGAVWRQMMADIYNLKIMKPNYLEEATSMGAAIIGGVGAGLFENFDAVDRFIKIESIQEPDPASREQYEKMMPIFDSCYTALLDVYDNLAKL